MSTTALNNESRDRAGFYVLKRNYSSLYKRVNYLSPLPIVQHRITEYDIRSANTSILRRAKKLKPATLDRIEELPRKERQVIIGKIIKKGPSVQKTISKGIIRAKRELFEANGIQDVDVLSIKNDAVYIIGRRLRTTQFGPVEFRPKNQYALYMNIEKVELYYDQKNHRVDIKGIRDDIVEDPDHQVGMMQFLATVMKYLVYDRRDALRKYLIEFSIQYKEKKLPVQYYKELNRENVYRTDIEISGYSFNLTTASDEDLEMINGVYNYKKFILPLIQLYI